MAVNEQIVTGRFYRRLIDEATKLWERISFWNKASDTECDDGTTVESKIGAFKGVTTSTNVTEEGYAIDATVIALINNKSGGSIIRGTTEETSLYSKTVYIQKDGINIASATIDSAGQFVVGGITEIGLLTATATDSSGNIATRNINVTTYSLYEIELNFAVIYAFHIDGALTDPTSIVTYLEDAKGMTPAYMNYGSGTFDYGDWENAFFMPKPCMLKQTGIVDYYLNPDNYTLKADGGSSDITNTAYGGNAMMEWGQNGKKIYYKTVPDSGDTTSGTVYISDTKIDEDYVDWSFINNQGDEVDHFYTPIYNGSNVSNVLRSMSGLTPINTQTGTTEITYAKANNLSDSILWNTEVYADIQLINYLLILMGRSTNMQETYGNGHYTGGSSASSLLKTGTMDTKGMFWGTNGTGSGVKVFGMEHWWGNQWRRYAGHVNVKGTQKIKLTYGTQDGSTTTGYNTDGTGYITIGATPSGTSGGYISKMYFTTYGMFPQVASGSETTFYCDGLWFNNSQTDYANRGGYSSNGLLCGAFAVSLSTAVSVSGWGSGAALSCKPLAQ